jgi:hypothetical protein
MIATVALLLAAGTSSGCLHRYVNNSKGFVYPSAPTVAVPSIVAAFNGPNTLNYFYGFHQAGTALVPMPVSPALSYEIEDLLDRLEHEGVPILGPIKGEFAPIFCMDPPSEKEIYETLPPIVHGVPFVWEVQRKGVRFSIEKIVDQVDECRVFPLAGPCQLHHCHFKCTIWYDETTTMGWPIPWTHTDHKQEVVYIDKDHLHRCGEPGNLAPAGGPSTLSHY